MFKLLNVCRKSSFCGLNYLITASVLLLCAAATDPEQAMSNADITVADFLKLYRLDGVADAENTFKFIK